MPQIIYNIEDVDRMLRTIQAEARADERERWLPLWEAVKALEGYTYEGITKVTAWEDLGKVINELRVQGER